MTDSDTAEARHQRFAMLSESLMCGDTSVVVEVDEDCFHCAVLVQEDEFGAEVVVREHAEVTPGSRLYLRMNQRREPCLAHAVLHIGNTTWLDLQWNWSNLDSP